MICLAQYSLSWVCFRLFVVTPAISTRVSQVFIAVFELVSLRPDRYFYFMALYWVNTLVLICALLNRAPELHVIVSC